MECRVLEVLDGRRAVVSTWGLRRVVIKRTQQVLAELLPEEEAEHFAETYNSVGSCEDRATVVTYKPRYGWQDRPLRVVQ